MAKRTVTLGSREVEYPSPLLQPAFDCGEYLRKGDFNSMREQLRRDGFIVVKGAIDGEAVRAARAHVLKYLADKGNVLVGNPDDAVLNPRCDLHCIPFMEGYNEVTHSAALQRVLAAPELQRMMEGILQVQQVRSFDYKWLRGVARAGFTGAHVDSVYMSRGSPRLHTVWIPLDHCTLELGALAMCEGSHRLPGFAKLQNTYGQLDVERDGLQGTGWFTNDPAEVAAMDEGAVWRTADYEPGDVVLFGMHTLHMSTANRTDRIRLSADVRWQPAEDSADPRYVGTAEQVDPRHRVKTGAYTPDDSGQQAAGQEKVTMGQLKARWGFLEPGVVHAAAS